MSGYYKQMRNGRGEAARQLDERLAREEVGDAAYEKQRSYHDDRPFKIFGVVFIVALGLVFLAVAWLGY